jgi:hypothetical protein
MSKDLIPTQAEITAIEVMAKQAVESKFIDKLGGFPGAFSIAMYARELNVPIMSALFGGFSNIMGKITIAPQLMNAMIRRAGHKLKIDSNDQRSIIVGTRKDTGESCEVSFSLEDARKAGLVKPNGGWEKYPSDMCFARALSRLARRLFPDVIGMAYVEGELDEEEKDKKENIETIETSSGEAKSIDNIDASNKFKETFKSIENMDYDLNDFVSFISEKSKKTSEETINQAIKNADRFSKSYLKWVEEKIESDKNMVLVKAEPMDMLSTR